MKQSIESLLFVKEYLKKMLKYEPCKEIIYKKLSAINTKILTYSTKKTIHYIIHIVCSYFIITETQLCKKSRKREIVEPRQIAHYFAKELLIQEMTLATIGEMIGDMDHATVLHSHKVVCDLMETDEKFKAMILEIEKLLK